MIAQSNWGPAAERIHGLSLELLDRQGMSIDQIVKCLNSELIGEWVLSGAPVFDWRWLQMLLESSNFGQWTFERMNASIDSLFVRETIERNVGSKELRFLFEMQEKAHNHAATQDAASWIAAIDAIPYAARGDMASVARIFESWRARAIAAAPWRRSECG